MIITDLYWRRYKIPFRRPFTNHYAKTQQREGALIFVETDTGIRGIGEIAPLEGFGGEIDPCLAFLGQARPALIGLELDQLLYHFVMQVIVYDFDIFASQVIDSGLALAVADIQAQSENKSIAEWLRGSPPLHTTIPVNATLSATDDDILVAEIHAARAQGFQCVKLKVGMCASLEAEVARVALVREALGQSIELRLDANGAWDTETAATFLQAVAPYHIGLIEQPTPPGDISAMAELRGKNLGIPIAADETGYNLDYAQAVIRKEAADVLVVKPMFVHGPVDAYAIAMEALENWVGVIITSLLDTGVGIAGAVQVAAALPDPLFTCGLATADLLEATLVKESLTPTKGLLIVPQGIGVGVTLDEAQLAEYCGPEERA